MASSFSRFSSILRLTSLLRLRLSFSISSSDIFNMLVLAASSMAMLTLSCDCRSAPIFFKNFYILSRFLEMRYLLGSSGLGDPSSIFLDTSRFCRWKSFSNVTLGDVPSPKGNSFTCSMVFLVLGSGLVRGDYPLGDNMCETNSVSVLMMLVVPLRGWPSMMLSRFSATIYGFCSS